MPPSLPSCLPACLPTYLLTNLCIPSDGWTMIIRFGQQVYLLERSPWAFPHHDDNILIIMQEIFEVDFDSDILILGTSNFGRLNASSQQNPKRISQFTHYFVFKTQNLHNICLCLYHLPLPLKN